jgi:hypothetical protein
VQKHLGTFDMTLADDDTRWVQFNDADGEDKGAIQVGSATFRLFFGLIFGVRNFLGCFSV